MNNRVCCFIGHREINETAQLKERLRKIVSKLITEKNMSDFLFGSKSRFNDLCYEIVTELKSEYPHIKRIYIRAEYPVIDESYADYLFRFYEESYYPEEQKGAGKAVYVERNRHMIDISDFCVFYYDRENLPATRKSGTLSALDYARNRKKQIIMTL
ncbi:MAG: DUF1273 family protein [Clostridia bacterium]|nr:DUF1273 family protein [Clostridia bacterium]